MSDLIAETLELYAKSCGDPYEAAFAKLYAANPDYEGLFFLDTDEGLRRNMMQTTLEMMKMPSAATMMRIKKKRKWIPLKPQRRKRKEKSARKNPLHYLCRC